MKKLSSITLVILISAICIAQTVAPRERVSLNDGWHFTKDDRAEAGTDLNYSVLRPWILPMGNTMTTNAPANAYNGLALVIVRAKPGAAGAIKLTATADGLKPATVGIKSH